MYSKLNAGKISKRTGKNTVALVGFANITRDFAPWEDEDTEIWGLNEAYLQPYMKRWDRWFQIHPEDNFNRDGNTNDPNHPAWLRDKHDFPIYMQEQYDYVPSCIKYPLEEVIDKFGSYLTSSFSFMFCLAMLEGFECIEPYGFEMGTHTEYHYQKPGAEYLIGMARGMGIKVPIHPMSTLCKGKMYGFETMDVPFRQKMEYHLESLEDDLKTKRDSAFIEKGKLEQLSLDMNRVRDGLPLDDALLSEQEIALRLAQGKHNFTMGAIFENKEITKMYDEFLVTIGVIPGQDVTSHGSGNVKKETSI